MRHIISKQKKTPCAIIGKNKQPRAGPKGGSEISGLAKHAFLPLFAVEYDFSSKFSLLQFWLTKRLLLSHPSDPDKFYFTDRPRQRIAYWLLPPP